MKVALNEISQSSIFVTAGNCFICLFILFTICGDVPMEIVLLYYPYWPWKNRLQHFEFSVCGSCKRVCLSPLCHWC